ncbi:MULTISPECIES: IclR family transcriptional regulator [unclassified Mycobacterium]|uniref:IclR family transcriptional regulator n=1 Tax=unclassified Mycobacterium TaxID=2642494 RepID=UPI0007FF5DA2|nr:MULTISPECIES: IclR family transcriptional regulator [unclassified Mycobacterium]OBG61082.1 IclR family transcriptional regulator [Mycobacterium sp. E735]OBG61505.1 IclR family transcriptional regulator [Mycobacterium sp. E188]OBG79529.1 IclR family transcriptional regulator [Mycobacterium sp. E3305]OBG94330.1 IclR family transcriptional regulator [Mycobacterium sp. E3298]OBH26815.1 IclR family transcriptional regulator [Mycobacterium sp. E1715]
MPSTGENSPTGRDEGIQVLRRAAAALDEIAAEPGRLRLVDLGERLGLAKSTARRLLVGLVEVGLASVDGQGRIALGDRLLGFGNSDGAHITAVFRPTIERVARATDGETVDLSVLRGQRMWFVDQLESSHRLRAVSAVGVRFPLESTANGKAALAALDDADAESVMSRLGAEAADRLRGEVAEIRRTGIAFDRDEHTPGISAAAIARRTVGDNVVAISVPAPTERFGEKEQRIVDALRAAAESPAWAR